jgi:hypothetical protein
MAQPQVILPQADSACGKVFYSDRRAADGHRVALEVWNRATGRVREGHRLAVYRCRRCGGFHIGQRPIHRMPVRTIPQVDPEVEPRPYELEGFCQVRELYARRRLLQGLGGR